MASFLNGAKLDRRRNPIPSPGTRSLLRKSATRSPQAPFFAGGDVGALFKYGVGTGGAEQYISHFTDNQHVNVSGPGMAVVVATPGTVWYVALGALVAPLTALAGGCVTNNYVTSPGACGTTFSSGTTPTIILQRTYEYPVQAAPFTVNEIGYHETNNNNGDANGGLVLGSPDTVAITEYYVVQIQVSVTLSPDAPTAVLNVVTGFDSSGQVMLNFWDCQIVQGNGSTDSYQSGWSARIMDGPTVQFGVYNQCRPDTGRRNPASARIAGGRHLRFRRRITVKCRAWRRASARALPVYLRHEWRNGLRLAFGRQGGSGITNIFVLLLTTPFVLPVGTFNGYIDFERDVTRTLTN